MTLPRCALRHQSDAHVRARQPSPPRWLSRLGMIALLSATITGAALAQSASISGTVTDAASAPIVAAQVSIVGTRYATATDANGRFHLTGMPDPVGTAVTLRARRIGYASQDLQVHVGDENVAIKLTTAAVSLNEVVVTGTPGSTERRALGVDVAQIDASSLVQKAPITDVQSLLNGRTPGVTLLANSGVVGAGSTVRIRGVSSFSLTNQPLIYVDGVRVDNSQSTGVKNQSFGAATTTRWNDFNPDDIESIEIVKGPAATTLYGTEAANGVIQIITKKGAIGKTTWDFNTRQGANWFSNPQGRLWTNFDTNAAGDTVSETYTDLQNAWHGQPIFTTGYRQGYDLGLGGGSPLLRYHVSGGYERNEGVESSNNDNDYTARASLGIFPNDKIDIAVDAGYTVNKTNLAGGGRIRRHHVDDVLRGSREHRHAAPRLPQRAAVVVSRAVPALPGDQPLHRQRRGESPPGVLVQPAARARYRRRLRGQRGAERDPPRPLLLLRYRRRLRLQERAHARHAHLHVELRGQPGPPRDVDPPIYDVARWRHHQARWQVRERIGPDFPAPGLTSLSSTTARQVTQETDTLDNTVGVFAQEEFAWRDRVFITGGVRLDNNSAFGRQVPQRVLSEGQWRVGDQRGAVLPSSVRHDAEAARGVRRIGTGAASVLVERDLHLRARSVRRGRDAVQHRQSESRSGARLRDGARLRRRHVARPRGRRVHVLLSAERRTRFCRSRSLRRSAIPARSS